jgi:hypothetical protein
MRKKFDKAKANYLDDDDFTSILERFGKAVPPIEVRQELYLLFWAMSRLVKMYLIRPCFMALILRKKTRQIQLKKY